MISRLPRVIDALPDRPKVGSPTHPMRIATRRAAFEPNFWNAREAADVAAFFDERAFEWDVRSGVGEMNPLRDALERGGALGGRCLEIGAGTGTGTAILADAFDHVIALDISGEMLAHFHDGVRADLVLADAAFLPFDDGSMDVIVLVNAFLFPSEVDRVLAVGGAIIWVSSLAEDTPIYLPTEDVVAAMPGPWTALTSDAGWGSWVVARRG